GIQTHRRAEDLYPLSCPTRRSSDLVTDWNALRPEIQASRPCLARLSGSTLRISQQPSGSHDQRRPASSLAASTAGSGCTTDELRSEEHTSELQSRENLVCRLLLVKN